MSNAITYTEKRSRKFVGYANDERAIVRGERMYSFPKNSTAIAYWAYDAKKQTLSVIYKGSPTVIPTVYIYEGIPFHEMFSMLTADSLGAFVAKQIKPNYSVA